VGERLTLAVKPQWVPYKLEETIEKFCSGLILDHGRLRIGGPRENHLQLMVGRDRKNNLFP
jgi:hypothetical protein